MVALGADVVAGLVWVRVACPDMSAELSVAVIVTACAVVELLIVAAYLPSLYSVVEPTWTFRSLAENATLSPVTMSPSASVTVAVAVLVEVPLATIDEGESATWTLVAGGGGGGGGGGGVVCVSVAVPATLGVTELSVAVIVGDPAVVELVSVAV